MSAHEIAVSEKKKVHPNQLCNHTTQHPLQVK